MLCRVALTLVCACVPCACKSERPTEFVSVAFTISVDTDDYKTWTFDEAACEDFNVDWMDHAALRAEMFESIEEVLADQGHVRTAADEADFLVSYEFWIEPGTTRETKVANAKGSIVIRDSDMGRFVWRATRKSPLVRRGDASDPGDRIHDFVETMLRYTTKL